MFGWLKSRREAPWFVASPSRRLAGVAAGVLAPDAAEFGDDVAMAPRGSRIALVLSDPLLAEALEARPLPAPANWLTQQCATLDIPVPSDGDFPFSTGKLELGGSAVLMRYESLHLLGKPPREAALEQIPDFDRRLRDARFDEVAIERAYADPAVEWLFRPFHRTMLRKKWAEGGSERLSGGELIVYHHIPKCAGMSVFQHLNRHLSWNDELIHLDARAERDVNAHGVVPFAHKDARELDRVRVLFGHDVSVADLARFPGRRPLLVTCLRDPASRMVSHYNWEMHQRELGGERIPDFESWYACQEPNWICRWLSRAYLRRPTESRGNEDIYREVETALDGFWKVGTSLTLAEAMQPMMEQLGLPPLTQSSNRAGESYPSRMQLDADWRARIESDHPFDLKLFMRYQPTQ